MRNAKFAILALIAAALLIGYFAANRSRGPDEDQIRALIERGRQAIERKSLDAAMSCVSKSYQDASGLNYDRVRMFTADAFRGEASYQVTVDSPEVQVNGDQATARTHASLTTATEGASDQVFSGSIVIHLKKERVRRYLILPARDWKVTRIDGLGGVLDLGV
jgi:ketosteroid isomerase-like protein